MNRIVYNILWLAALPLLPLRLWWRGRHEPGYRERMGERFGRYAIARPPGEVLWVHAVSVGETRAALPLIEKVLAQRPALHIVLTHMTATGRATGHALLKDRVTQAWLPYDVPFAVRRFLDWSRPKLGVLIETELWPNLVHECERAGIPVLLANARLSERSVRGYRRTGSLARDMLRSLTGVAAQSAEDAQRLVSLGARDVFVTGNFKFDVTPSASALEAARELRERFGRSRPVLTLASTREGEEPLLFDALARNAGNLPSDLLIVVVPRHPQRFDEVADLLRTRGLRFVRRTAMDTAGADVRVVLGDSMGEMFAYYGASDVAFVAGSLLPHGGQNLLEPIALGVPVLVGPHTFNFAEAARAAVHAGAAIRVGDADELFERAATLLADPQKRATMSRCANAFIAEHRGATQHVWEWLELRV